MKRSHHLQIILALICIGAVAWMLAQPQSATPTHAQAPPPPPTPTPDGGNPCIGNATISGTVLDMDGNPVKDAAVRLDKTLSGQGMTFCTVAYTDENGEFVVSNFRAAEWTLVVEPPLLDETLFATQGMNITLEDGDTINFDEPFILSDAQVTAKSTAQDGTTPMFAKYFLYQPRDFNEDGEAACYLSTPGVERPFDLLYYELEDLVSSEYIVFDEYARENGMIKLGNLPIGDYCLRVNVIDVRADPPGNAYFPVIERAFSIDDVAVAVDLGTLVPDATPKQLNITTVTENGEPAADFLLSVYDKTPPAGGAYGKTDAGGNISFELSGGTWGIYQPETEGVIFIEYALDALLQEVIFADDTSTETQDVTIVVDANPDSAATGTIQGTVRRPDGSPAIGAAGTIALSSGTAGANDWKWQQTQIDPETATFEAQISAGTWHLTYSLHVYSADDEYASYKPIGEAVTVPVEENETVQYGMMLIGFDSSVRGSVLKPDGTAISDGRVWMRDGGFTRRPVDIIDGVFETQLLSGIEYMIEVDDALGNLAGSGFGLPNLYRLTATPDSTNEIELQLRTIDASITGTVYKEDLLIHNTELLGLQKLPIQDAEVYAIAPDGQCIHAVTNEDGQFTISVPSGTTWEVTASWGTPWPERAFYTTVGKTEVVVAAPQAYEVDLSVSDVPIKLPPELDETFDVAEAWSGTLDDGTKIEVPANAVPVADQDGDDIRVVVRPFTNWLPRGYELEVIKYGYAIDLFNVHTGEQIISSLNHSMMITYIYDDAVLNAMNSSAESLGVSARSEYAQDWEPVSSVNIDEATNTLSISLDQPTAAAITARPQRDAADNAVDNDANGTPSESTADVSFFVPILIK